MKAKIELDIQIHDDDMDYLEYILDQVKDVAAELGCDVEKVSLTSDTTYLMKGGRALLPGRDANVIDAEFEESADENIEAEKSQDS